METAILYTHTSTSKVRKEERKNKKNDKSRSSKLTSQGHQNWSEKGLNKKERGNKKREHLKKILRLFFLCVCVIDFSLFH